MHADQVDITVDTVAGLIRDQFPEWRHRPVRALPSHGTVNALFLLGDEIILRFPLQPSLDTELRDELVIEQDIARRVAAHVPLQVPEPLAIGEPGDGYAGSWTAYRWIPGETASEETIGDADGFARDLAAFVNALQPAIPIDARLRSTRRPVSAAADGRASRRSSPFPITSTRTRSWRRRPATRSTPFSPDRLPDARQPARRSGRGHPRDRSRGSRCRR